MFILVRILRDFHYFILYLKSKLNNDEKRKRLLKKMEKCTYATRNF